MNVKTSEEDRVPQDIKRSMCVCLALVHSVAMKKFQSCIYESGNINSDCELPAHTTVWDRSGN